MPLYSKKDFAALVGIEPKHVSTMKARGKIVYADDPKFIDSADPINKVFIEERALVMAKEGKTVQMPKAGMPAVPGKTDKKEPADKDDIYRFEIKRKENEVAIQNLEIAKRRIDIEKKQGDVIPVAPIAGLVFQFKQYMLTFMSSAFERALIELGHKYTITSEDIAHYRGVNKKLLNDAVATASSTFVGDFNKNLSEFSSLKGVGEHG